MGVRVLLIEDDETIAEPLADGLRHFGLAVHHVATGADGLRGPHGDVVLLDLGLPDMDGIDVCRGIRRSSDVPIIILSARGEEADRVLGLELGADDYLAKPFSIRELVARIRAVSRRHQRPGPGQGAPAGPFGPPGFRGEEFTVRGEVLSGSAAAAGAGAEPGAGAGTGPEAGTRAGADAGAAAEPGRRTGAWADPGARAGSRFDAGAGTRPGVSSSAEYDWATAYETPAHGTPSPGFPAHDASAQEASAQGAFPQGASARETSPHGTSAQAAAAHRPQAFGTPPHGTPGHGIPTPGGSPFAGPPFGTPPHGTPVHEPPVYEPPAYEQAPAEPRDASDPAAAGDRSVPSPGPLVVDRRTRQVWVGDVPVALTPKEFELLALLTEDPGAVYSRQQILHRVWDDHYQGPTKTLDVHVATLRRKLGDPAWIQTLRGVGFRLAVRAPGPGQGRGPGPGPDRRHTPEAAAS